MAASKYLNGALRALTSQLRLRGGVTVETLAATYTFGPESPNVGYFDADSSNRNMQLEAEELSEGFFGIYVNSGSAGSLVFLNDAAGTVATVAPGEMVVLSCDGSAWGAAVTITEAGVHTWAGTQTFSVPIVLPAGSVSAPSLGAASDANTGLYFPAADVVGLVAGGVEYSRVKHDGTAPTLFDYSAPRASYRARAAMADADATLSDAQFRGGIVSMTPTATRTLTTRTAAQMVAAFPGCQVGSSYELEVVNLAAAQVVALAGGAGVTLVGVANVSGTATNLSGAGKFRLVFTNVTASSEAADLVRTG